MHEVNEPSPFPYNPDSISWRVNRESVLLLGGRRALLMQLAHPLVAQGVADHSRFAKDRIGRLLATLQLSFKIVFGVPSDAREAVARINAVHRTVHGVLPEAAGPYQSGTAYRADDPDLLLWVHATLVDTAVTFYERFVASMSHEESEDFYSETSRGTELLGIPPTALPADYRAFRAYLQDMSRSQQLTVTPTARKLAAEILYPPGNLIPKRIFDPLNIITIGTLPPQLREGYGLRWNPGRTAALRVVTSAVRRIVSVAPKRVRYVPAARAAEERLLKSIWQDAHT